MKNLKRILCALLCLATLLALGVFAKADEAADPYMPVIIWQPLTSSILVGDSLELEVWASVEKGTLSYAWYDFDWTPDAEAEPVATGYKMSIPITESMLNSPSKSFSIGPYFTEEYCVVVTNTYVDADGVEQTKFVKSDRIPVRILGKLGKGLADIWLRISSFIDYQPLGWILTVIFSPLLLISSFFVLASYPLLFLLIKQYQQ